MNKKKKMLFVIIAIIAVILTIGLTILEASVSSINGSNDWKKGMILAVGNENTTIYEEVFDPDNNFYCVKENQDLPIDIPVFLYLFAGYVKIDGDDADFYGSAEKENADLTETDDDGNTYYYKHLGHVNNPVNNLLAAILTTNTDIHDINLQKLQAEYDVNGEWPEDVDPDELGKVQMSLHLLWHKWATDTGAHQYGFRSSNAADTEIYRKIVAEWIAKAEKLTPYFNFKATIKQGYPLFGAWQDLIRVEIDPPTEKTEDITIVKKWVDKGYEAEYRPDSIKLDLYAKYEDGKDKDTLIDTVEFKTSDFNGNYSNEVTFTHEIDENYTTYDASGKVTIKLKIDEDNNTWTCTWEGLKAKDSKTELEITYRAEEAQETINKLKPAYKHEAISEKEITNTLQTTNVKVIKVWDDSNNKYSKRPQSITMLLKGNGKTLKEITLTGGSTENAWQTTVEVPVYDTQGNVNKFTVEEISVSDPYKAYIGDAVESELGDGFVITITNKYEEDPPPETKVTVNKEWIDGKNKDGTRPDSITVTLTDKNGTPITTNVFGEKIVPVKLNEANKWTYTFEHIPVYDESGAEINYTIKETVVDGYTTEISPKSGDSTNGYRFTITNTQTTDVLVEKVWEHNENAEENWPKSVHIDLTMGGTTTLSTDLVKEKDWKHTFTDLPKYNIDGQLIEYDVKETLNSDDYQQVGTVEKIQEAPGVFKLKITNEYIPDPPELTEVSVKKVWTDDNNRDGKRPDEIEVVLYATNVEGIEEQKVTLNESNKWSYTFNNLLKYKDDQEIKYEVKETLNLNDEEYTPKTSISGNATDGFKFIIENTYEPKKVDIDVTKEWDDIKDIDDLRPDSITVKLLADGVDTGKILTISEINNWKGSFKDLYKYKNEGQQITYTVQEAQVSGYENPVIESIGTTTINGKETYQIKVTNKHTPNYDGYVEITGRVWIDGFTGKANDINGTYGDDKDTLLQDGDKVKVILKDANGNQIKSTYTNEYGDLTRTDYALITSSSDGTYTIRVNYDNSKNVYKLYEDEATVRTKLETAYVEFEYDGVKYTTVASAITGANTSKAIENESQRLEYDQNNTMITSQTNRNDWNGTITAKTNTILSYEEKAEERDVVVKYCNEKGTEHTNPLGAWKEIVTNNEVCEENNGTEHTHKYGVKVEVIPNINLGLFKREEPDVAIFSDLTKVQVTMNGQQYTYLYGVRGSDKNNVGLQAKFQNKDTYTYKRPVNPVDIAYVNQVDNNAMSVLVTYEVKVANLSTTLPVTVHNIINSYDSEYTLNTQGWRVTDANGFKQATSGDLNITVNPQTESSAIELTYTVSLDAIRNLLNEQETLNNAVEIGSYTTIYGETTLYAEQRTGGRADKPYAGYDYNSHPGNAGIFINNEGRLEAAILEDDTDIAPSFALHKDDEAKTLAGTIWEDADANKNDEERLGNGYQDDAEKYVENVKVELYKPDGTLAKLYNEETKQFDRDAVTYTDANGNYSLDGVVTGEEYYIKYTYGDDIEKLGHEATTIDGGATKVNARNYKSTIIVEETIKNILSKDYANFSEEDKMWAVRHNDRYSVAVDNMNDRLKVEDLQNNNFNNAQNMTAYTKPFIVKLEFDETDETSSIKTDGENKKQENGEIVLSGDITDATNVLDKLDFGMAERPREDLFAEKTIKYFKIILANGQVLTEGNPNEADANINYAKIMGFDQQINSGEAARKALEKQILVEMDAELMQGAHLEVEYAVKITNNNELDYDYGVYEDYKVEFENEGKREYDKYITKNSKANYYYYGNKSGLDEISTTIEIVDYMSSDIVYKEDTAKWVDANVDELHNGGLISDNTYKAINDNQYRVFRNAGGTSITLKRKASFEQTMTANKLLSNEEDNVYDNNVEIIKIDGRTARTIKESDKGKQVEKTYTPGNYEPSLEEGAFEQDDDRVKIIITPPTGLLNNIITYVIIALSGLLIMFAVVIIIKKRQLNK